MILGYVSSADNVTTPTRSVTLADGYEAASEKRQFGRHIWRFVSRYRAVPVSGLLRSLQNVDL